MDAGKSPPSTFVSVVAWIFIAISALGVLISILQNIIFGFIATQEEFKQAFTEAQQQDIPGFMLFFFEHIQLILAISLLLIVMLLVASIGLLRRRNWARKVFITYMAVICLYMVAGTIAQQYWMADMMQAQGFNTSNAAPSSFMDLFKAIQYVIMIFNIGLGLVFGWIGWKLTQPGIKQEFIASA